MDNKTNNKSAHNLALISVGIMAYIFADIFHEAIGHGLTSLILGNKITLLTSVYFRSERHSFITDAFGPIANLLCGLIIWAILKKFYIPNFYIRLLLILTMAFNFFWFSWMCVYCGITNKGDFAFYFPSEESLHIWRIFLIIFGLLAYYTTFRLTLDQINFQDIPTSIQIRQLFLIPYLSAGIFALVAVSFFRPISFGNYYEALTFLMFLPTLFFARQPRSNNYTDNKNLVKGEKHIIVLGLALAVMFCLTMGQGLKL